MDQHRHRFHNETGWRFGSEIQHNLHADAGTHRCDSVRKPAGDWAMNMPTSDTFDLWMFFDQFSKFPTSIEGFNIHVTDGRGKRWMVHENQGRGCRFFLKFPAKPTQPARSQPSAMLPGRNRIEANQPDGKIFQDITDIGTISPLDPLRKVFMVRKSSCKVVLLVMITGN